MITYPELGLPEAWKPLFKAMADAGWELEAALGPQEQLDCRLQSGGLTVVGLSEELPGNRSTAEEHALLLSGAWEEEVNGFVDDFFAKTRQKYGVDC